MPVRFEVFIGIGLAHVFLSCGFEAAARGEALVGLAGPLALEGEHKVHFATDDLA